LPCQGTKSLLSESKGGVFPAFFHFSFQLLLDEFIYALWSAVAPERRYFLGVLGGHFCLGGAAWF